MKKISALAAAVLATSIVVTSSITAFAASNTEGVAISGKQQMVFSLFNDGERPELTEEQKAEMQAQQLDRLTQMFEEGKISQEKYDQAVADMAEGKITMMFGRGMGLPNDGERPELTEEQKAEMQAQQLDRLTQMLEEGKITQEQYDQAMADMAEGKMTRMFGRGMGLPNDEERPEFTERGFQHSV